MEEIRKDDEKEVVLLKITHKIPMFINLLFIVLATVCVVMEIMSITQAKKMDIPLNHVYLFILIGIVLLYFLVMFIVSNSKCKITNKKIFSEFLTNTINSVKYSRLDKIDNVSAGSFLGANYIVINYKQGNLNGKNNNKFKLLLFVADFYDVVEKLIQLINEQNTDLNTWAKIEGQRTDAISELSNKTNKKA